MEQPEKNKKYYIPLMLFAWVLALLLCKSVYLKAAEMTESSDQHSYSLRLKSEAVPQSGFRYDELQELRKVFSQEEIAFCAFNKLSVSAEPFKDTVLICGVGGDYLQLNNIRLINGAYLNEQDFTNKNNAAVIEDRAAKALFNSTDVAGMKIKILGSTFTVIGVAANDASIAGTLTEADLPRIYIPLSTIEGKGTDFYITNLEVVSGEDPMDEAAIMEKLASMGKAPEDFIMVDNNELVALAKQRFDFILFIIGVYCICLFALFAANTLKSILSTISRKTRKEYLRNAIKKSMGTLLTELAKLGAALTGIVLVWKGISFELYVQQDKLPNDPTSLVQIIKAIQTGLRDFLTWDYAYMLHEQRVLSLLDKCGSIIFILCLVLTVILLVMSKGVKQQGEQENVRTACIICLWLGVSIILSSVFILSLGMPVALTLKNLLLLNSSMLVIILGQSRVKGAVNENISAGE